MEITSAEKLSQEHSTEFRGMPVIIEWPKGSTRVGDRPDGTQFKTEMKADYGYIPDTTAAGDKEKLDIYIGPDKDSDYAYIVEQLDEKGEFDEYKIMLGFDTLEEAESTYLEHVDEKLLGDISEVPFEYLFDAVSEQQEKEIDGKVGTIDHYEGDKVAVRFEDGKLRLCSKAELEEVKKADQKYTVIEAFLKNYKHEVDFYDECAELVKDRLEQALQDAGIKAVVSCRAKSPDRLKKKLYKRDKTKHYQSFRQIYDDIVDLAGCRVALYMPADAATVGKVIENLFVSVRPPKHFPEEADEGSSLGYVATHYLVTLRPDTLRKKELRYADTQIEIQVASVLMHAWSEVTHDLLYKPEKGPLTPEEHQMLDHLNSLVQKGETELTRLQKAIEDRTDERLRFEIEAAVANTLKDRSMGKAATLTVGMVKNAAEAIIGTTGTPWSSYAKATETLHKAKWNTRPRLHRQDVLDDKLRKYWESQGIVKNEPSPDDETHFIHEAMDQLAPGKPYNTLWVQPNRNEIIALAQELKAEAKIVK